MKSRSTRRPWIDLWRDNYAFVASRVAAGLRALLEQAPRQNGVLPLSGFSAPLRPSANAADRAGHDRLRPTLFGK